MCRRIGKSSAVGMETSYEDRNRSNPQGIQKQITERALGSERDKSKSLVAPPEKLFSNTKEKS